MASLAPLSTHHGPAGGLGVQGQKWGAERVWGEGRHRAGAVRGLGHGARASQLPGASSLLSLPPRSSRGQTAPGSFRSRCLRVPGVGNKSAGRENRAPGAWTSSEFTQVCTHVCVAQDAPPQGGGRRVIHSLPSVNARPSQLRTRTALTPAEPANIAGSSPPEARCQRPSVGGGGAGSGAEVALSWHLVSCSGRPELEDRAFHPCQLQGSLSCSAHHPPLSPCPALRLSGHSAPRGGTLGSCWLPARAAYVSSSAWIFQRMVFLFPILSCLLYNLRIFIKHSMIGALGLSLPWRASCSPPREASTPFRE